MISAGNVKEWSWNEAAHHKRYILGGAWREPAYMFHEADAGRHSSETRLSDFAA